MEFIKNRSIFLVLFLCVAGVLGAMYYEGFATERWGEMRSETLESFKAAVEEALPMTVDAWKANVDEDVIGIENEDVRRVAGAYGSLARRYRGSYENPDIHINITCGFSRNVGAHTPDVCFVGSGNEQLDSVEKLSVGYIVELPDPNDPEKMIPEDRIATFNTAVFRGWDQNGNSYDQRVFWGWKDAEEGWQAPRFPRMKWQPNEPICKMYVSLLETKDGDTMKVAEEFLKVFLPKVDPLLNGKYHGLKSAMYADGNAEGESTSGEPLTSDGGADAVMGEAEDEVLTNAPVLEDDEDDSSLELGIPDGTLEPEKDAKQEKQEEEEDEFTL